MSTNKLKLSVIFFSAMSFCGILHCAVAPEASKIQPSKVAGQWPGSPGFLYSYIDFKFDSTESSSNYNRFQGNTNLYGVGGDFPLSNRFISGLSAGLYGLVVDTHVNSQFIISPNNLNLGTQKINNATVLGHVNKFFTSNVDFDVSGGYGQNEIQANTTINADLPSSAIGTSNYNNTDWFASVFGFYQKSWDKLQFKANLGVLHSQVNTGHYLLSFPAINTFQTIPTSISTITYLIEGIEFDYRLYDRFTPFVDVDLLQVVQFHNSATVVSPIINGTLPQFNVDQNGYRVGAGFNAQLYGLIMRVEEKYYNAENIFTDFQTLVTLIYKF